MSQQAVPGQPTSCIGGPSTSPRADFVSGQHEKHGDFTVLVPSAARTLGGGWAPDHRLCLSHRHPMLLPSASTRALDAARLLLRAAVTARPTSTCCRSCARRPPPACRRRAHRPPLGADS